MLMGPRAGSATTTPRFPWEPALEPIPFRLLHPTNVSDLVMGVATGEEILASGARMGRYG